MEGADEFSEGHQFPTLDVKEVPASSFSASVPASSFNASIPTSSFNASVPASSSSASVPISLPGFQPSLGLKLSSEMDTSSDQCTMEQERMKTASLILREVNTTSDIIGKYVKRFALSGASIKGRMRDQQYLAQLPNRSGLMAIRERLHRTMSIVNKIAAVDIKPIPPSTVSVASDLSVRQCTCGSYHNHEVLLSETRRILKSFDDDKKDLHRALSRHRLKLESVSIAEDETESESSSRKILLRSLLKKVVTKFKCIDQNNYRSLVENQQAINKLKELGYTEEYNVLQHLHNVKVCSESEACASEITKLFENCHL